MSLFVCGLSHHSAPLAVRESLALSADKSSELLRSLQNQCAANEVIVLSTCNRFEVYACAQNDQAILQHVADFCAVDQAKLSPHWYSYQGEEATSHLMQVACGIDSMVVGESQICHQIKKAYAGAQAEGTVGTLLEYLFQRALGVSKQVRSHSDLGGSIVSVAYLAVELARRIYDDFSNLRVMILGTGETAELAALHLKHVVSPSLLCRVVLLSKASVWQSV